MPTPDYTALQNSIADASFNIGKTNRELRDKVQLLSKVQEDSSKELSLRIQTLTDAIKDEAKSSGRLATVMIWLTVVLAIAAVASAAAAFIGLTKGVAAQ
jgi:phage-related protein